jgi:quercetin dioxygenase-like cupin family protein
MNITPKGARPTNRGPAAYFTGRVEVGWIIDAPQSERVRMGIVGFEPGARTAWHTHPLGQTLYILSGRAQVQTWGGPIREVGEGDTVWFPPGEKHWHGAGPDGPMMHLAIQEALDGKTVEWMEAVSEGEYGGT